MDYLGFALAAIVAVGVGLFLVSRGRIFEDQNSMFTLALTYAFIIGFTVGTREWLPFLNPEGTFYTIVKYLTPILGGVTFLVVTYWCFKKALRLRNQVK